MPKDNSNIRKLILAALDDEQGINEKAYCEVVEICNEQKWQDILDNIRAMEDRYYLPSGHDLK